MNFLNLMVSSEDLKQSFPRGTPLDFFCAGLASCFSLEKLPDFKKCLDALNSLQELELIDEEVKREYLSKFFLKFMVRKQVLDLTSSLSLDNIVSFNTETQLIAFLNHFYLIIQDFIAIKPFQYFFIGRFTGKFPKADIKKALSEISEKITIQEDSNESILTEILCSGLLAYADQLSKPEEEEKSNINNNYSQEERKSNENAYKNVDYYHENEEDLVIPRVQEAESEAAIQKILEMEQQDMLLALKLKEDEERNCELTCPICLEKIESEFYPLENCPHSFHNECLMEYIKGKVHEKQIPIKCPQCNVPISQRDVLDFLPDENIKKKFLDF